MSGLFKGVPPAVRVVEVGPRDGLQNEPAVVPLGAKLALIDALSRAGLSTIEAGAFVSQRLVPQMADSGLVLQRLQRLPGVAYPVLVPKLAGFEAALVAGAREIAVFAAASETFSQRNINCSIGESLERFRPVTARARSEGIKVRGYVSCALGCPYEGAVAPAAVVAVATALAGLGCDDICIADTIGVGTARAVEELVRLLSAELPIASLSLHLHDTCGQALANVLIGLELGIPTIDSAVAGLGGCPFAPGAAGNLATEDLLYMLEGLGLSTGIDLDAVMRAGEAVCAVLGRPGRSRAASALRVRAETRTVPG